MAELPMLALILQRDSMPMAIGSSSGSLTLAGMIMRPAATSSRMSSGASCSRSATKTISSVSRPLRAKCICDMLVSPLRAASSRRFVIHSARGLGTPAPLFLLPLVALICFRSSCDMNLLYCRITRPPAAQEIQQHASSQQHDAQHDDLTYRQRLVWLAG